MGTTATVDAPLLTMPVLRDSKPEAEAAPGSEAGPGLVRGRAEAGQPQPEAPRQTQNDAGTGTGPGDSVDSGEHWYKVAAADSRRSSAVLDEHPAAGEPASAQHRANILVGEDGERGGGPGHGAVCHSAGDSGGRRASVGHSGDSFQQPVVPELLAAMASLCLFAYSSILQVTLSLLYCVPVPSLTSTASELRLLISGALVCSYGGWQVRRVRQDSSLALL